MCYLAVIMVSCRKSTFKFSLAELVLMQCIKKMLLGDFFFSPAGNISIRKCVPAPFFLQPNKCRTKPELMLGCVLP